MGDDCHHNIVGVTKNEARDIIVNKKIEEFHICCNDSNDGYRQLTSSDLAADE